MESLALPLQRTSGEESLPFQWLFLSFPSVIFLNRNGKLKRKTIQSFFFFNYYARTSNKTEFLLENSGAGWSSIFERLMQIL